MRSYKNHKAVDFLDFTESRLENVNVSGSSSLRSLLVCESEDLQYLNVRRCGNLRYLSLSNTQVREIDLKACRHLRSLSARNSSVSYLDLYDCVNITSLVLANTKLSGLDIRRNPKLVNLDVSFTELSDTSLEYLAYHLCLAEQTNGLLNIKQHRPQSYIGKLYTDILVRRGWIIIA